MKRNFYCIIPLVFAFMLSGCAGDKLGGGLGDSLGSMGSMAGGLMGNNLGGAMQAGLGGGAGGANLAETSDNFMKNMFNAFNNMLEAAEKMNKASGNHEQAEKLRLQIEHMNAKNNSGELSAEDFTKSYEMLDESQAFDQERLDKMNVHSEEGQKLVALSAVHLGFAVFFDVRAVQSGSTLIQQATNAGPVEIATGGFLKVINVARTAATELPKQISQLRKWSTDLSAYMTEHDIKPLSSSEKSAVLDDFGGDTISKDEMSDMDS
jgi:hypothetical protein